MKNRNKINMVRTRKKKLGKKSIMCNVEANFAKDSLLANFYKPDNCL